jgi:transposase
MEAEMRSTLGIDIAKNKFDAALLCEGKYRTHVFDNTDVGHSQLLAWLQKFAVDGTHACLEATGEYGTALAVFLADHNVAVRVVNPTQIKGFAQSELSRTKTDKTDAKIIARFCQAHQPPVWQPPPPSVRELQILVRRLDALNEIFRMEANRLQTAHPLVAGSIQEHLEQLEHQVALMRGLIKKHIENHPDLREKRDLLETIPGVGDATIMQILTFLTTQTQPFRHAKQVAAFLGLNPQQHTSGGSVKWKARLSKTGDSRLRTALYMPAIMAMRWNPVIRAFSQRLLATGKPKMVVVGACMRKLVHIIFGVLKSGTPFSLESGKQA